MYIQILLHVFLALEISALKIQETDSDLNPSQNMSHLVRKSTICIFENKAADQLCANREADQRLCLRYTNSTIPLLSKFKISSLYPSSVLVQPGLCQTCSETTLLVFPRGGSYHFYLSCCFSGERLLPTYMP